MVAWKSRKRPSDAVDIAKYRLVGDQLDRAVACAFPQRPQAIEKVSTDFGQWLPLGKGYWAKSLLSAAERTVFLSHAQADEAGLPPLSNTGGKGNEVQIHKDGKPGLRTVHLLMTDDGKVKEILARTGWGDDLAFVDQVSFTVHEDTCHALAGAYCVSDEEFIIAMSEKLEAIFGFGVTSKRDKGMNFYRNTWILGDGYGHLSFGGQRETMLIQVTATGCTAAFDGWEMRLYDFLSHQADQPRITRVDCAFDDFDGEYTVDMAYAEATAGLYRAGGRQPFIERRSDWDNPDGSGRTLYVGKRANGKFFRGYEKGKEQGASASPWVRLEVEFKSVDRVIPFEVLIDTGAYFAAAYPAFERFRGRKTPKRIETIVKTAEHAIDHYLHYAQLQVGRLVNFMKDRAGWDDQSIVSKLARPGAGHPERLKYSNFDCGEGNRQFLHNTPAIPRPDHYGMVPLPI